MEDITQNENLIKSIREECIEYIDYNKFSKHENIGEGTFGTAIKAEWSDCGLTVVLKSLKANETTEKKAARMFIKELKFLRSVSAHPNIIKFYGVTLVPQNLVSNGQPIQSSSITTDDPQNLVSNGQLIQQSSIATAASQNLVNNSQLIRPSSINTADNTRMTPLIQSIAA
ncbi:3266_t:CDS:2 [Cetraspora pellucida]|uniref:3266_t:CDS:1 n=1 Tax=Cetraspora pellucida TaxID=1433469 RepID=A0ACA9K5J1_9GLOM|nr:3266_t:CDS:2 [Cetraspora pellucida]